MKFRTSNLGLAKTLFVLVLLVVNMEAKSSEVIYFALFLFLSTISFEFKIFVPINPEY